MTKKWTKGNWRVVDEYLEINQLPRTAIMAFEDEAEKNICRLSLRSPEEELANAHLIAAAVNGCQAVNPDNPMAVAEAIQEMYKALKGLLEGLDNPMRVPAFELVDIACLALAKAEGKLAPHR